MRSDKKSLKRITRPIFDDIKLFEEELKSALHSEVRLINMIGKYIIHHKGKLIRPILTILSSRVCGQPSLNSYKAAAMIELLHIATLIHDDVVDEAEKRRGFPSINRVWKNKIAVLMGDFILSKALINMISIKDFDALECISNTAEKLSSGELLQLEKSITKTMSESVYFDMIKQKTASLIACSCELGAITTKKKNSDRKAMYSYGENLGIAFQIKDDLLDLLGSENEIGKNKGGDIKRNMVTLPLIHAKRKMSAKQNRILKNLLNQLKKNKNVLDKIINLIKEAGGIKYTTGKLDYFSNKALGDIESYPESEFKESMINLVLFNKNRFS